MISDFDSAETFLTNFFSRDDRDHDKFFTVAKPLILSTARRNTYRLAEDQLEEVLQEVRIRCLFIPASAFDTVRMTGAQFLFGLTLNAIRKVERSYGLRPPKIGEKAVSFVPLDDEIEIPAAIDIVRTVENVVLAHELFSL